MRVRRPAACVPFLIVAVYGLLLFVKMVQTEFFPPQASSYSMCHRNLRSLYGLFMQYYDHSGRFPSKGEWVHDVGKYLGTLGHPRTLEEALKCPSDKSGDISSYEMNPALPTLDLNTLSERQKATTYIVREKPFANSHGGVLYLDGHTEDSVYGKRP